MDEIKKEKKIKDKLALTAAYLTGAYAIIATILSISFGAEKNRLKHEYEALQIENSNLQTQYNHLSDAYDNLMAENINLQDNEFPNNSTHDIFIQIICPIVKIRSAPNITSDIIDHALQGDIFLLLIR